jgi:energy-coupling factor transport system ATP-binding protein
VGVVRRPAVGLTAAHPRSVPAPALSEVDMKVRAGEVVAVVGASGAGKSTLTALLAGVLSPTTGAVTAADWLRDGAAPAPGGWSSPELAERVGWVPQQAELAVVSRTVREDVLSTSRVLGLDDDAAQRRADALLEALGLGALADVDPHHLSGGEMRRLALAGAIAHGPGLLVLDEPTVGQDRLTWAAVAGVVAAARTAGVAVVLATHDPLLAGLADRTVRLSGGRVVAATQAEAPAAAHPSAPDAPSGPGGLAAACGPLSLLGASALLLLGALFVRDLPVALAGIGVELLLAPLVLGWGRPSLRRLAPGLLAVLSVAFSNWLLSPGRDVAAGATAGLRIAFFVLPGVLLAARVDPFALGDHLGQRLRLPARPVVAAAAALQRFESLDTQWHQLRRTRRVRGLDGGRSPAARARQVAALTAGLLVQSLRQAGRMAVAMEARGFSAPLAQGRRRTWAEPAPWLRADSLMTALGLAVAAVPAVLAWAR